MKHLYIFLLFVIRRTGWFAGATLIMPLVVMGQAPDVSVHAAGIAMQSPVFVQNNGQWNAEALYCLSTPNLSVWCTRTGIVYDHRSAVQSIGSEQRRHRRMAGQVVHMQFAGASKFPGVHPADPVPASFNYFYGADSSAWAHDVPGFRELWYRGVYKGIDLRLYEENGRPRYDLIVQPGGRPDAIALVFDGAEHVRVTDRTVHLELKEGEILQDGLYAYQNGEDGRREIACRFVSRSDGAIGFEMGAYDPSRPLVIDPLVYSTFVGGTLGDEGYGIALDASSNVYIVGSTLSLNYPTTPGAYETDRHQGSDIVVSKINSSGGGMIYSTFIGGEDDDFGYAIAVDPQGRAAITGSTFSNDFPLTAQAWDRTLGGDRDIVVVNLSPTGNALVGSTYLGGNNWDEGYAVAVDGGGAIYVTGMSTSTDFPTVGAADDSHNGAQDAVVAKLSANAGNLLYGTFLGGQSSDYGNAIAVDNGGNIYVGGTTGSNNFPAQNSFDNTFNGSAGTTDGFIAKIASAGFVYVAFLGGIDNDEVHCLALDGQNEVWAGGATSSPTPGFPVIAGAYDNTLNGIDGFVAHVNAAGSELTACTYIGQINVDVVTGLAVDAGRNVYCTGYTQSSSFPTTADGHDRSYNGGDRDAFFVKFAPALNTSSLLYGTYLGGSNYDEGKAIAIDADGNGYVTGITKSNNFPATAGSYSRTFGGLSDAFVTKFGTAPPVLELREPVGGEMWCRGTRQKIQWTSRSVAYVRVELSTNAGVTYAVVLADTVAAALGSWAWSIPASFPPGPQYRIRIVSLADASVLSACKSNITINAPPVIVQQPLNAVSCVGTTATFQVVASGFPEPLVRWQRSRDGGKTWEDVTGSAGKENPLVLTGVALAQHNEQYRAVLVNICNNDGLVSSTATLSVRAQPKIVSAPASVTICKGGSALLTVEADEPGVTYQWRKNGQPISGANGRQLAISNAQAGSAGRYDVVVSGVCPPAAISTAAVVSVQMPPEVTRQPVFRNILCTGENRDTTLTLTNTGPEDINVRVTTITNPRFSIVDPVGDFTIAAGEARQMTVRFTPQQARIETGNLVLTTTPCDHEVTIALGAKADSVHLVSTSVDMEPLFQCDRERMVKLRVINTGDIRLAVHQAIFSHTDFSLVSPALPFDIEPNGKWTEVTVKYADDGTNSTPTATVRFVSDTCAGLETVSTLTVRRAVLDFQPAQSSIDFGTLSSCNSHTDQSFLLFNTGSVGVNIDSIVIDNPAFGIVSPVSAFNIGTRDLREVVVRFTGAATEGPTTGTLTLFENKCRIGRSIALTGTKIGPSLASAVASVHLGMYRSCTGLRDTSFTIVNYDTDTVTVDNVQCGAPFGIAAPSFPVSLAPRDSLTVAVRFSPVFDGDFTEQAVFAYRAGTCSSSVSVALAASRHTPLLASEPSAIDALTLEGCEASRDTFLIMRNTGRIPVTVASAAGAPSVRLLSVLPVTLAPGEQDTLRIRIEPVHSDIQESLHLLLEECDSTVTVPVRARRSGVVYALSPADGGDTLRFGDIFQCGPQQDIRRLVVGVTPESGIPVESTVSLVSLTPAGPFAVSLASGTRLNEREQQFDVTFTPATEGTFTAVLSVTFMPCGITKTLVLQGRSLRTEVRTSTAELDFGVLQKGGSRLRTLTFLNSGTASVEIPSVTVPAPFDVVSTIPQLPATLAPGDSLVVTVRYTAGEGKEEGVGVAVVSSVCPDSLTVALRGEGRDLPRTVLTAIPLDFDDVQIGLSVKRELIIANVGVVPATIFVAPTITGADAALFTVVTAPAASIAPDDSTVLEIAFRPLTVGTKHAICTIEYNGIPLEVTLTGRGVDDEPAPATSTVFLPDTAATPFTRNIQLPLTLVPGAGFSYAAVDSFTAVIRFNTSLFLLRTVQHAVVTADSLVQLPDVTERVLTITGAHHDTTELCTLVGDVLLGDALSTPLTLDFSWTKSAVTARSRNGKLTLKGVDPSQLLRAKDRPGIVSVSPNPSSDVAEVNVIAIEDGLHSLELYDVNGRRVWTATWQNRSPLGRLSATRAFVLPVFSFASGKYSLRFVAPGGYMHTVPVTIVH